MNTTICIPRCRSGVVPETLELVLVELKRLANDGFWGEFTVKFQSGVPVVATKTEQIKIKN